MKVALRVGEIHDPDDLPPGSQPAEPRLVTEPDGTVRTDDDLQMTRIIAMSGKLTEEEAKGLVATGFDSFLKKPFHVRQVIEAVEDAMAVVY